MDSKIYHRKEAVFHCSMVKRFFPNDNGRFPGLSHAKPVPILVQELPNGTLRRCGTTVNAMARPSFWSNVKDTPTATIVGNR